VLKAFLNPKQTGKNYIMERKRALRYIRLRIVYVEFIVRLGAKLRC